GDAHTPGEAMVWDARTGALRLQLKGHAREVLSVAFSPDGTRVVTGSNDNTARVWDAKTGVPLLELKGRTAVGSVAFSPAGDRIVTGNVGEKKVCDAKTGTELKGQPVPKTIPNDRISPDGRFFARANGDRVQLVPLQPDAKELAFRLLHTQPNVRRYRE